MGTEEWVGSARFLHSTHSDSSFSHEIYSDPARSGPASDDEEESSVTESSESRPQSGLGFLQRPVNDSDSDNSQAGKSCALPFPKDQRKH